MTGEDTYETGTVQIDTDLPPVWLGGVDDAALFRALAGVRACASVHGALLPRHPAYRDRLTHGIIIFLAELRDDAQAASLERIAAAKSASGDDIARAGVRHGKLFCLLIAKSFIVGVAPAETAQSVQRFVPRIAAILQAH